MFKNLHFHDKTEEGGIEFAMLSQTDPELAKQIMQESREDQNGVFGSDESKK